MAEITIDMIDRGNIKIDPNAQVEGHRMATATNPHPKADRIEGPVYCLVVDHPSATILWDTGSHPEAGEGHWPEDLYDSTEHYDADEHHLEDDLAAAGWTLEDIDAVVMSHLHIDHAGELYHFDGTNTPVYVHRDELEYAYYSACTTEGSDGYVAADFHHDLNWQIVHGDRKEHFQDFEFIKLPGHTPGMMGARARIDGYGTVVLTSDLVYRSVNFEDEVPLGAGLLWNREEWLLSVREVKDIERRHDVRTILYGHDSDQVARYAGGFPE